MNRKTKREGRSPKEEIKLRSRKIQTMLKKAVELVIQHKVELLFVLYSPDTKCWVEYSTKDASQLIFDLQTAKEHMDKVETWQTEKVSNAKTYETDHEASQSPPPTKRPKQRSEMPQLSKPTDIVSKEMESDVSTISTCETIPKLSRIKGSPTSLELPESPTFPHQTVDFAQLSEQQEIYHSQPTTSDLEPDDFLLF